jgi:hypothetical protein
MQQPGASSRFRRRGPDMMSAKREPMLGVGIAIPGQFPNPGIRDYRGRDPGIPEHNAHVIRDSDPGPTFSIPGFGIETFLMPRSRRDYITTRGTL